MTFLRIDTKNNQDRIGTAVTFNVFPIGILHSLTLFVIARRSFEPVLGC